MLETRFLLDKEGITVPYPPLFDEIRNNYGFLDLRGRPDLVSSVPEVLQSQALRSLLIQLSEPASPIFSLGCDLGAHTDSDSEECTRHVAGGYVQLVSSTYADRSSDDYYALATAIGRTMEQKSQQQNWKLDFLLTIVALNLDDFYDLTPSLRIWFCAAANTPRAAVHSREVLISELEVALDAEMEGLSPANRLKRTNCGQQKTSSCCKPRVL